MASKFNFEGELKNIIIEQFKMFEISIPKNKGIRDLLLDYLTTSKKIIHLKKRRVLINPHFKTSLLKHPKKKEIEFIINLLEKGINVNLFQSEKVFQTGYHDQLMYNWHIYHLHLSLLQDKKSKFMKRTNTLLFVYITNDKAIVLGTEKHTNEVFGDIKWLEILHDHFPKELEHLKPVDMVDTSHTYSSIERQQLWNNGVASGFVKIRETLYMSPGIGIMTSGHSILVAKTRNEFLRWIFIITEQFEKHSKGIEEYFGHEINPILISDGKFKIVDSKTNTHYLNYLETFNITENNN